MEIRPTREDDLPALSRLFELRFGHPLAPEEWRWKYGQLAAHGVGESRSWVALEEGGELLAHAGAVAFPARWKGGTGPVWQLVDFVGTTARRGLRPAFVELGRRLLADLPRPGDVPFLFGFPGERHFRLGGRVFGYLPLTEMQVYAGELPEGEAREGAIATFDQAFSGIESVWEGSGALGVIRSAPFLNWRYYARPRRYYRFYRLEARLEARLDTGGATGLAVFAFAGEEALAAELWLPGAEADWRVPLLAVAADLRELGLRRWRFWEPVQPYLRGTLEGMGLVAAGERQFVGCRGGVDGVDPQAAAAGFTYSLGDFDMT